MENEELNKKITNWLGLCWHEFTVSDEVDPVISYCNKCGKPGYEYDLEFRTWDPINQNIEFTGSPSACFKRIMPMLEDWKLEKDKEAIVAWVRFNGKLRNYRNKKPALALCKATEQVIDEESLK